MLVSTSYMPSDELQEQSQQLAERLNGRFVPRRKRTVNQLRKRYGKQPILLVTEQGLRLYGEEAQPLFFHPSMAAIRVQRLLAGETDPMLETAGVEQGDTVLDCTAGLASDAIVFSFAVGEQGRVSALESNIAIHCLLEEGLSSYSSDIPGLTEALRRTDVIRAEHLEYLRQLPDRSRDIVYFDPMFRHPVEESASITPLREFANSSPISRDAVAEARRVARKCVLLKEHRGSGEFERLGFERIERSYSKIIYGVVRI